MQRSRNVPQGLLRMLCCMNAEAPNTDQWNRNLQGGPFASTPHSRVSKKRDAIEQEIGSNSLGGLR